MEKIHVLLVEDELTLAMIIKDTLEEQEFIITTASDGEDRWSARGCRGLHAVSGLQPQAGRMGAQ